MYYGRDYTLYLYSLIFDRHRRKMQRNESSTTRPGKWRIKGILNFKAGNAEKVILRNTVTVIMDSCNLLKKKEINSKTNRWSWMRRGASPCELNFKDFLEFFMISLKSWNLSYNSREFKDFKGFQTSKILQNIENFWKIIDFEEISLRSGNSNTSKDFKLKKSYESSKIFEKLKI